MATLDGTVTLAHVAEGAILIACDLDLDVAWFEDVLLHVHTRVAERSAGFLARLFEGLLELLLFPHEAHALATAAGRGFQDHRVTDAFGLLLCQGDVRDQSFRARHHRNARCDHRGFRRGLVAHGLDLLRRGADELDAVLLAQLAELGVLAQEPVTRVDRIGIGDLRRSDDAYHVEVALLARWGADAHGLIREAHMQAFLVGGGVDRNGLDAHFAAGADHAQGDLAAVGYEDLLEHGRLLVWFTTEARRTQRRRTTPLGHSGRGDRLRACQAFLCALCASVVNAL